MACARALGIRGPATAVVRTRAELAAWLAAHGCPAVLKTDGSYGGRGVRIVHSPAEAHRTWDVLGAPPSAGRALKRALVNRDMNYLVPWLRRTRPIVNAQRFVAGQDANCTVACWKGTVLASITVAVLRTVGPRGPASVIRPIEHREIQAAVETIVGRLKLSGLIGLDFLLEDGTGAAHLIELNPRAPQVGHLPLGPGRDLPAALRAVLSGEPIRPTPPVTEADVIALFPQEWMRDAESPFLQTAYHDVPWEEPDLLRACVVEPIAVRAWSALSGR
jgi:biotin carboxylase